MFATPASVVKPLELILLVEEGIVSPLNRQRELGLALMPSWMTTLPPEAISFQFYSSIIFLKYIIESKLFGFI